MKTKGIVNEFAKLSWTALAATLCYAILAYPQVTFAQIYGIRTIEKSSQRGLQKSTVISVSNDLTELKKAYAEYVQNGHSEYYEICKALLLIQDNRVVIDAIASGDVEALLEELRALGLQEGTAYGQMVSGQLPIEAIEGLATLSNLHSIRACYARTNAGLGNSQGDVAMRSGKARNNFGVDGSGVTVGTLSDSFDDLGGAASDVASGSLPPGIAVLADLGGGGTDEGRAMMQLIHDVAPGASQAFHTALKGEADFASGIIDLATVAGANVIVDDVIYFAEPMFQDGIIAQAVEAVKAMGVTYFSAAGNQNRDAYQSEFRDSGVPGVFGGIRHDFDPGPGVDDLQSFTLATGTTIFSFQWDEPYASVSGAPGSASDVDIVLYVGGTFIGIGGFDFNIGRDPVEVFAVINSGPPITVELGLELFDGPPPKLMKYVFFGPSANTVVDFPTNTGTTYGHANAAGAEAVGAARYTLTPEFGVSPAVIEAFSSAGTTPILFDLAGNRLTAPEIRLKPGIVGPSGTNTTFFFAGVDFEPDGSPNFFGTSASAPHVAAVAALMKQADPSLTPSETFSILRKTADDMDDPFTSGFDVGFDEGTGFGFIQADIAVAKAATVLFADDDIWLSSFGNSEGKIHSNGKIQLYQGNPNASTLAGNITAVEGVIVKQNNTIDGNVSAPKVTLISHPDISNFEEKNIDHVDLLDCPPFTVGAKNITVRKNQTSVLNPGAYGIVKVQKGATLQLTAGEYAFRNLYIQKDAVLEVVTGKVTVFVEEGMTFDKRSEVVIASGNSQDLSICSNQEGRFTIGQGALVFGDILAPNGQVRLLSNSSFKGTICAEEIRVDSGARFLPHGSSTSLPKIDMPDDPTDEDDEEEDTIAAAVTDYELASNYPNPFNPSTMISFSLPETGSVTLQVFTETGQLIRTLVDAELNAGRYSKRWDGRDRNGNVVAAGMYFYKLIVTGQNGEVVFNQTNRMTLVK